MGNSLGGCCCCGIANLALNNNDGQPKWTEVLASDLENELDLSDEGYDYNEQVLVRLRNRLRNEAELKPSGWIKLKDSFPLQSAAWTIDFPIPLSPPSNEDNPSVRLEIRDPNDASVLEFFDYRWKSKSVSTTTGLGSGTINSEDKWFRFLDSSILPGERPVVNSSSLTFAMDGKYCHVSRIAAEVREQAYFRDVQVGNLASWEWGSRKQHYTRFVVGSFGNLTGNDICLERFNPYPQPWDYSGFAELWIRPSLLSHEFLSPLQILISQTRYRRFHRTYHKSSCSFFGGCSHNGPSYVTPQWELASIDWTAGLWEFPNARIDAVAGIEPGARKYYDWLESVTSEIPSKLHSFSNCRSHTYQPTTQKHRTEIELQTKTIAYLEVPGFPGDDNLGDNAGKMEFDFLPGYIIDRGDLGGLGVRSPANLTDTTSEGSQWGAVDVTRSYGGGGLIDFPVVIDEVQASMTTVVQRSGKRLISGIVQFDYLSLGDGEELSLLSPWKHAGLGSGNGSMATVSVECKESDGFKYNEATNFLNDLTGTEAIEGLAHPSMIVGNRYYLASPRTYRGPLPFWRNIGLRYQKEIDDWNGPPPVVTFTGDDLYHMTLLGVGTQDFDSAFDTFPITTKLNVEVSGSISVQGYTEVGSFSGLTGHLDVTDTGKIKYTPTNVTGSAKQLSMKFRPAITSVGHPAEIPIEDISINDLAHEQWPDESE